jgi:hypothetical protein
VQDLLTAVSRVRVALRDAHEAGDALYAEVDHQGALAALDTAYDAIKATAPYAVCPWCRGQSPMQRECRGCGGRGVLGQFRWDTIVPREMKA